MTCCTWPTQMNGNFKFPVEVEVACSVHIKTLKPELSWCHVANTFTCRIRVKKQSNIMGKMVIILGIRCCQYSWLPLFPPLCSLSLHNSSLPDIAVLNYWLIFILCKKMYVVLLRCVYTYSSSQFSPSLFPSAYQSTIY